LMLMLMLMLIDIDIDGVIIYVSRLEQSDNVSSNLD